jgi:hypothetical protein
MPVEAWTKTKATGWKGVAVMRLLAIARGALPKAAVSIKWGHPVIEEGGPVAFIKVASAHVTLGFWRGAELRDPDGVLQGGERMKHIKITSLDELDEKRIVGLLGQAGALNRKLGDPTRG